MEGLLQLGVNAAMRNDYLIQLTPEDYCEGPKDDDESSREGKIWVFGMKIGDLEVYNKLKVVGEEPFDTAICLSFHPAERPLAYPFRIQRKRGGNS